MAEKSTFKVGFILDTSLDLEDGVQQYVMTMGEWLRRQGHDVHYLVGQTVTRQLPNIHSLSKNITVTFNGNKIDMPLFGKKSAIKKLIEEENFDILHVQSPHHPFMAQWIIRAAGADTAVVASFHVLPYDKTAEVGNKLLGYILRPSLKRIDKMLAVSSSAAAFEERSFGLKAEISPNVFDYNVFHKAEPLPQYDDEVLTILFLGRLVPRKGCQTLLSAIAILSQRTDLPKFRVVVCGKGKLDVSLKAQVKKDHMEDLVEFAGFVSDALKPRYYASADISVFPSSAGESFGIVLLEAMASGKAAVLAGDNPGYRTVMEPKPELLFPATDAAELAERLEELLMNKAKRDEVSGWGATYTAAYDVNVVGTKLVQIYSDLYRTRNMQ